MRRAAVAWLLCVGLGSCGPADHVVEASAIAPAVTPKRLQPNRASVEELVERLRPHLSRSADGLAFRADARGRVHVDLAGRAQHVMLATPIPGGGVRYTCVDDAVEAEKALREAPTPPLGTPTTSPAPPTIESTEPEGPTR